jgi:hypothetical protein
LPLGHFLKEEQVRDRYGTAGELNLDAVIHCLADLLLAPDISLGRLYARMA